VLLLAPLGPAALTAWWHPRAPAWSSAAEVAGVASVEPGAVPEGALWVDAREPAEFAAGHVPGAVALGETAWEEGLANFVERWEPGVLVVVYCGGAECEAARRVAERLRMELGIEEVAVLRGGWTAWQKAGRPEARP
jgi:rhodanese-related sulfurtransferase